MNRITLPSLATVDVVMTAYNGLSFLSSQIDSILKQEDVKVLLHVVDDGSTDGTQEYLSHLHEEGIIQTFFCTDNIGTSKALNLAIMTLSGKNYMAISDQDDVWRFDKLKKSINKINNNIEPTLCTSGKNIIDVNGGFISFTCVSSKRLGVNNAIVESSISGNCMVLNAPGVRLLQSNFPKDLYAYDAWIYLLFSVLGRICVVPEPLVDYRQHQANQIGHRKKRSISRFRKSREAMFAQHLRFVDSIGESMFNSRVVNGKLLIKFLELRDRFPIYLLQQVRIKRSSRRETLLYYFLHAYILLLVKVSWRSREH